MEDKMDLTSEPSNMDTGWIGSVGFISPLSPLIGSVAEPYNTHY